MIILDLNQELPVDSVKQFSVLTKFCQKEISLLASTEIQEEEKLLSMV